MASNYDQYPLSFDFVEGFAPRMENSVEVGNSSLWGSLDVGSYIYQTYSASVGLTENAGWQIGATDDLNFEYSREMAELEIGNVTATGVYELESEEAQLTMNMYEWKPAAIAFVFNTTYSVVSTKDGLIEFGGGCVLSSRPVVVRGTNIGCNADAITGLVDGLDYATLTLYDCYSSGGSTLPFSARESAPIPVTLIVKPVLAMTAGTRLGNLYVATD